MSEKSKGDTSSSSTSRIINNPLLSANVTNLTFDDFQNKPVILPAAPPIIHTAPEDVTESSITAKRTVTVGQTPDIDADTLSEINLNPTDEEQLIQQQQQLLQQYQYQQIDLNDNNAFPQIQHEPRLINNNEIADDSILSQAASSFSQLPSVASTVLSTFSKVINNYSPGSAIISGGGNNSREQSSEREYNTGGINQLQQQQQQQQQHILNQTPGLEQFPGSGGFNNQYLNLSQSSSSVTTPEPPKLYTPPPAGSNTILQKTPAALPPPLTAGGNTYRLSSKKKTYAQIPGLSVNNPSNTDTTSQSLPNQDINIPPPISNAPAELINTIPIQSGSQPLNSFLNDTQPTTQSNSIFGNYTQDLYPQQNNPLPKSDKTSSSSVGGLFSGVSGVIQNLSGLVKSTVTSESNQPFQRNEIDSYNNQYNREPEIVQGFVVPPIAFIDPGYNTTQIPNPADQPIGFESIQSAVPFNLNQQNIKPSAPPAAKPPTVASGSSFRLQKGTRLYKSPFEQASAASGVNPPYPTSTQQQPDFFNLPSPPVNYNPAIQGIPITENLPSIPAPEKFQNFPPQNLPPSSQFYNPQQPSVLAPANNQENLIAGPVPFFQGTQSPVQLFNPQNQTQSEKLIDQQQLNSAAPKTQQSVQANQFFQPLVEPPLSTPIKSFDNQTEVTQVNFFNQQSLSNNPEQVSVERLSNQVNLIRPPSVNQTTEPLNQIAHGGITDTSNNRPLSRQKTPIIATENLPAVFGQFNAQLENNSIQNKLPYTAQSNFLVSEPSLVPVPQSQLGNTHLGQPSTGTSFIPFDSSIKTNNQTQINSFPVEANHLSQEKLVQKTAELNLHEGHTPLATKPPVGNLPPPSIGLPPSSASGANPFRRDSGKSHHTVAAPINFFAPKPEAETPHLTASTLPPANQINLSASHQVPILKSTATQPSTINSAPQATVSQQGSTVDYFDPVTSNDWVQQVIKEANPNISETSILNPIESQVINPTLDCSEPFPDRFNFSNLISGENSSLKYLPPSIKPKPRTDSSSENNCPPQIFRPPVPLPTVDGQPQIEPGATIASFYNPTPSHQWAQQVINAAQQGLNEIPQQDNTENSKIFEGTIEPEEEFPEQFDFSSVLPQEGVVHKYLPPPIDNNLKTEEIENLSSEEKVKILKITKETLPEGIPSCVGEYLTEASQQPKVITLLDNKTKDKITDSTNLDRTNKNLTNYFDQQQLQSKESSSNNLGSVNLTTPSSNQYFSPEESTIPTNSIQPNFFQPQPTPTQNPLQITDFFNSNQNTSVPVQQFPVQSQFQSTVQISQQEIINKTPSVDKNLNFNVSEKSTPEKCQQSNLLSNFFQQPNQQQQQISINNQINQNELFQNNKQRQQQQIQNQSQQQQPISAASFFDQFSSTNNNLGTAQINQTQQQQQQLTASGSLNEEEQRIQNFFNNPPPQNLNNNSVNELNFNNLYGCGGVDEINTKQFSDNPELNFLTCKYIDNRSTTPASNIVEPPSSACSEFSSDNINNSNQNIINQQNITGFNQNLSDYYLNEIPDELVPELNKMASNVSIQNTQCNVVYTAAKKHWFYKKLELNKKLWTPFTHKDSDALEESFLKKDRNIVPVEGGRYDVNINERTRVPIYWNGEPTEVRRCSWFFKSVDSKYVPYEEETAEFLESEYREASNSGEWRKKVSLGNGETVVFHAPTVLVHFLQSQTSDAWGGASQSTIKPRVVKRDLDDFTIEAGETDKVDHLLFMVHGIGSACDLKFRVVEEVVEEFRSIAYQLVQAHYKNSVENGDVGRVEVLPVSWHHELHSAECGIDEQLKAITLESIPKLRNFANDTVVDALFYTSPVFCQYIINTVANCMNRVYLKFCQRNTNFSGQVSLAGHSLGSLILFDLLCNQKPVEDNETNSENLDQYLEPQKVPTSVIHNQQVSYTFGKIGAGQPTIEYPQLLFAPKKFFALGSPIGLFATVRGISKLGLDFKFPTCPGFYNIFHPYDPIAYRIEALINPEFSSIRPVLIPHHKGRKRMHLELKETMTRVGTEVKQRIAEIFKGSMETIFFLSTKNKAEDQQEMEKEVDKVLDIQLKMDQPIRTASSSSSDLQSAEDLNEINMTVGKLNDSKRIDYVLQEAPLEFFNEYLFALTSHVCYWDSEDTILFLVKEIYSSLGISTDATVPQQNMTIERPSSRNTPTSSPTSPQKVFKIN